MYIQSGEKMGVKNKRGQILGLPFQLIFSIILIVVFIYVAVIAIKSILQTGEQLKAANFVSDFRNDLEKSMATTESSVTQKYSLPSGIKYLCFTPNANGMKVNSTYFPELANYKLQQGKYVFFYPPSYSEKTKIPAYAKVDCENSCLQLAGKNPYCIAVNNGIASITIIKEIGNPYVTIK